MQDNFWQIAEMGHIPEKQQITYLKPLLICPVDAPNGATHINLEGDLFCRVREDGKAFFWRDGWRVLRNFKIDRGRQLNQDGEKLQATRRAAGMTKRGLARLIGCSALTIYLIERGKVSDRSKILKRYQQWAEQEKKRRLGKTLKRVRTARRKSIRQVAEDIGCCLTAIQMIEDGRGMFRWTKAYCQWARVRYE